MPVLPSYLQKPNTILHWHRRCVVALALPKAIVIGLKKSLLWRYKTT